VITVFMPFSLKDLFATTRPVQVINPSFDRTPVTT